MLGGLCDTRIRQTGMPRLYPPMGPRPPRGFETRRHMLKDFELSAVLVRRNGESEPPLLALAALYVRETKTC